MTSLRDKCFGTRHKEYNELLVLCVYTKITKIQKHNFPCSYYISNNLLIIFAASNNFNCNIYTFILILKTELLNETPKKTFSITYIIDVRRMYLADYTK